jgi:signal transduction histidine kinase
VCYGIAAEHGARMEVDSEVGVGSTFRIIFAPVSPEPHATTPASEQATRISQ